MSMFYRHVGVGVPRSNSYWKSGAETLIQNYIYMDGFDPCYNIHALTVHALVLVMPSQQNGLRE